MNLTRKTPTIATVASILPLQHLNALNNCFFSQDHHAVELSSNGVSKNQHRFRRQGRSIRSNSKRILQRVNSARNISQTWRRNNAKRMNVFRRMCYPKKKEQAKEKSMDRSDANEAASLRRADSKDLKGEALSMITPCIDNRIETHDLLHYREILNDPDLLEFLKNEQGDSQLKVTGHSLLRRLGLYYETFQPADERVRDGDLTAITPAIVNLVGMKNRTAVHGAVLQNYTEMLEKLLTMKARINEQLDHLGFSPLHYSILLKRMDLLRMMNGEIQHDGNWIKSNKGMASLSGAESKDRGGRTPLMLAASIRNRIDILRYLIANGANVNETDSDGYSALHYALKYNNYDCAEELISHGANVNFERSIFIDTIQGEVKISLLSDFARKGDKKAVFFLLKNGAILLTENKDDWCWPLYFALRGHHFKLCDFLIDVCLPLVNTSALNKQRIGGISLLLQLLFENDVEAARYFRRSAKIQMNKIDHYVYLRTAVESGKNTVKEALQNLFNVEGSDIKNIEAFHICAAQLWIDGLEFLFNEEKMIKDINCVEYTISSPLLFSVVNGHRDKYKTAKWLLKNGANINQKYSQGETILHQISVDLGFVPPREIPEMIKFLIENKADLNIQDSDGNTPLHHFIKHNHIDLVRELINRGAFLSLRNKANMNCLEFARTLKRDEIVELIETRLRTVIGKSPRLQDVVRQRIEHLESQRLSSQ